MPIKYRDLIRLLQRDGWYHHSTTGSHQQFKHPERLGRVMAVGKPNQDVPQGTRKSILRQAGLN